MKHTLEPSAEELASRLTLLSLGGTSEVWPNVNPIFMQECAAKLREQAREIETKTSAINFTLKRATMGHQSMSKLREAVKL